MEALEAVEMLKTWCSMQLRVEGVRNGGEV